MLLPTPTDLRAMSRLALPVVTVQVGIMTMGVADTVMVGHVSARALASVALGNLYFYVVGVFGMGVLMALDPVVAQAVGARDEEAIARAVQRGLAIVLALTIVSSLVLYPGAVVMTALRQPAEVIPDAARYARICIPGVLPYFAFIVFRQSLQAMGRVAPIVVTVIVANACNVLLNWALIFGHAGMPGLGVSGAAWATTISRWIMALLLLALASRQLRAHLAPLRQASLAAEPLARMARLGVPIGLQYMLEYGAFAVTALLMGLIGTHEMAAHQIAINLASLTFMVPFGVSAATAVLVGQAIGEGDEQRARRAASAGMLCGVGFMVIFGIVFTVAPRMLAGFYTRDATVLALAATLLPIAGLFQVFDGTQTVAAGILRGAGDTHAPMAINVLGFWLIGLPASAWLAFRGGLGAEGLWWGFVAGLGSVALLLVLRVRTRMRREMRRVVIDRGFGIGD